MTLFWILLGLMVLVAIAAIVFPFLFSARSISRAHTLVLAALVVSVSLASFFLYDSYGEPQLVAEAPEPVVSDDVLQMIRQLEQLMAVNPNDPEGWLLLARSYTRMGEVGKAMDAYRNVVTLDPENTTAAAALGGLLISSSQDGMVPAEAMQLFEGIVDQGIMQPMAYYFLGLGHLQMGEYEEAHDVWSVLAENSPAQAPWMQMLRDGFAEINAETGRPVPDLPPPPAEGE